MSSVLPSNKQKFNKLDILEFYIIMYLFVPEIRKIFVVDGTMDSATETSLPTETVFTVPSL